MESMTGYGSQTLTVNNLIWHIECTSLNRKVGIEIIVIVPKGYSILESKIRDEIKKHIQRGRISVILFHENRNLATNENESSSLINRSFLQKLIFEIEQLNLEFNFLTKKELIHLCLIPNVLKINSFQDDPSDLWKAIFPVFLSALLEMKEMRIQEGKYLIADITNRLHSIQNSTDSIVEHLEEKKEESAIKLIKKIKEMNISELETSPSLMREIISLVEKSDITEELVRLKSHLKQSYAFLEKRNTSRNLDYLLQEMLREWNTIAAKSNDLLITQYVITSKVEIDKIREQINNLE